MIDRILDRAIELVGVAVLLCCWSAPLLAAL